MIIVEMDQSILKKVRLIHNESYEIKDPMLIY